VREKQQSSWNLGVLGITRVIAGCFVVSDRGVEASESLENTVYRKIIEPRSLISRRSAFSYNSRAERLQSRDTFIPK
jgi:hypothetical protein